jgi:hypothetical protein
MIQRMALPICGRSQAFEELLQRPVVGHNGGDLDVLVRAVLSCAADTEGDGGDAACGVERPVAGAVLVQEAGGVALTLRGPPQLLDLPAVMVGVVRRVEVVDGDVTSGSQKVCRYSVISRSVLPLRSASSAGKRMSSHASAWAGIWLKARLGVSTLARFTVVRQTSSAATGYLANSRVTVFTTLTRALSPSHG